MRVMFLVALSFFSFSLFSSSPSLDTCKPWWTVWSLYTMTRSRCRLVDLQEEREKVASEIPTLVPRTPRHWLTGRFFSLSPQQDRIKWGLECNNQEQQCY